MDETEDEFSNDYQNRTFFRPRHNGEWQEEKDCDDRDRANDINSLR